MRNLGACLVVIAALVVSMGCGEAAAPTEETDEVTAAAPAAADEQTEEAPAPAAVEAPAAAPAPAGLTAAAVGVPFHELTREALETALREGGWEIGTSTSARSGMFSISTSAEKSGVRATISYFRGGGDFWRSRLTQSPAATRIDEENDAILGVLIESNPDAQQPLLDSLFPPAP